MKALTTGDCSRVLRMSPNAVNRLIDSGHLRGFRVPGSLHRRVTREAMRAFMVKHDIPLEWLEQQEAVV